MKLTLVVVRGGDDDGAKKFELQVGDKWLSKPLLALVRSVAKKAGVDKEASLGIWRRGKVLDGSEALSKAVADGDVVRVEAAAAAAPPPAPAAPPPRPPRVVDERNSYRLKQRHGSMLKDRVTRRRYGEVPMAGDAVRRFDVRDPSERRAAVAVAAAGRACVLAHAELLPSSALREWTLDVLCEQIAGPCHVLRSASRRYTYYKDEQVEEHELAPADAAAPPPPPRVCEKAYSTMAAFVEERARRRAKRRRGPGSYLQTRLLRYDLEDGGRPASFIFERLWASSISRETLGVFKLRETLGVVGFSRDSGRRRFLERLWPGRRSRSAGGDALEAFAKGEFERPGFMQTVPGVGPRVLETFERLNGPLVEEIRAAGNFGTWIATQLFVSDLGDTTLLHYDEADNLFLQARGAKRFDLYEPSHGNAAALAPFPVHSRRDRNARPGPGAAKLEVVVRDGDVLFVPAYWWHQVETLADDTLSLNFWFHSHIYIAFANDATDVPLPAQLLPVLARQVEVLAADNLGAAFVPDFMVRLCDDVGVAHEGQCRWPPEEPVDELIRAFVVERLGENLGGPELVKPFVAAFLHPRRWAPEEAL